MHWHLDIFEFLFILPKQISPPDLERERKEVIKPIASQ